jgi:hypothetical protein
MIVHLRVQNPSKQGVFHAIYAVIGASETKPAVS